MYNDIVKKLVHLNHKELTALVLHVANEIAHRETLEPIGWSCPHCEFTDKVFFKVVAHLETEHNLDKVKAIYAAKGVFA